MSRWFGFKLKRTFCGKLPPDTSIFICLYLLDYQLPDGLGVEVCLYIRTFDTKTPILFYTGTTLLTEQQARTLGAQGLIKKGDTFSNDLWAAISRFL